MPPEFFKPSKLLLEQSTYLFRKIVFDSTRWLPCVLD